MIYNTLRFILVNKSIFTNSLISRKFYRQLSSNANFNQNDNNNHQKQFYNKIIKGIGVGFAIIGIGTLCNINMDKPDQHKSFGISNLINLIFLPTLEAATNINLNSDLSGRRGQFNFIADVVEVSAPSVVYIEIKDTRRFDYFSGQAITASNGSGFIVEANGLILTNAHVVISKPHSTVLVKLYDGRIFPGIVEDVDKTSDLATVRIKCDNLTAMKLGESSKLRAGEFVVALGSPLSLSNTVTSGVVSSIQRPSEELGLRGRNINYIQTDAAITFGNSGGPLVNLDGEAIGINSMKVTPGISFAIPIDYAKTFLKNSLERKSTAGYTQKQSPIRRYMGITMLTLTDEILAELKQRSHAVSNDVKNGVLVYKVIMGSPAHAGGLNPGDIITHINSTIVNSSTDVHDALETISKDLEMIIWRGQTKLKVVIQPENP